MKKKKDKRDEIYVLLKNDISNCIQTILEKIFTMGIKLDIETLFYIHQKKVELQIYIKQLFELDGGFSTKEYVDINLFYLLNETDIMKGINKLEDYMKRKELNIYNSYKKEKR